MTGEIPVRIELVTHLVNRTDVHTRTDSLHPESPVGRLFTPSTVEVKITHTDGTRTYTRLPERTTTP